MINGLIYQEDMTVVYAPVAEQQTWKELKGEIGNSPIRIGY